MNILSVVTGIKKEGRLPKIFDERLDSSIKIIVLDIRGNTGPNPTNDSQHCSKFKKMPKEIWDNVLKIGYSVRPNQSTDCPIQTSPANTINVYTNILPKHPPAQPPQSQPFLPPQLMQNTMMNPYSNNAGMFQPGMMYNTNNNMFNQSNYASVMAAAQSIVNAATAYNNMFVPNNYHPHHRLLTPQPTPMISPHQQQHMQYIQAQQQPSPQPANSQIKRKPVQFQPKPVSYLSPQIEKRLQRKKTIPPPQPPPPLPLPQMNKKKVTFAEKPVIEYFERYECEDQADEEEYEDEIVIEDDDQDILREEHPYYYHDKDQRYTDQEEEETYYTQQQHYHPNRSYPKNDNRGHYYMYEDQDEEEDYGELWKRRSFITRHNSKYKSRA